MPAPSVRAEVCALGSNGLPFVPTTTDTMTKVRAAHLLAGRGGGHSSPSKRSWAFKRSAMGRLGARHNVRTTPSDRSRRKRRELPAYWSSLGAYPFTRSLADRGIALCGSILRVMTRIRCPLA
jgi:hypothetical protein